MSEQGPILIRSKEQFTNILKTSTLVVVDCEPLLYPLDS